MDYYKLLNITKNSNNADIKEAYRKKALLLHPDVNPNPSAAKEFKEVVNAYKTLIDPVKRRNYDRITLPYDKPKNKKEEQKETKITTKVELWNIADVPEKNVDIWGDPILKTQEFIDTIEYYSSESVPKIR